ncbi:MAG: stage III sporulation protein AA [Clostridiaceae bacterium]|nr:stage III sporulation protein AA [Clostridiaceae bacterium]
MWHEKDGCERFDELISLYLPERIKAAVRGIKHEYLEELEELRIRAGQPLMGVFAGFDHFIGKDGFLSDNPQFALTISSKEVDNLFMLLCEHSVYAYQDDISRGFITLKGGHRAGICGTVIYEGTVIKGMKDISSVNIRFSRQIKDCARDVFGYIVRNKQDIYNTLILSPPRCGKTTLLRDLCRIVSSGTGVTFKGLRTAVIDERSELAASYRGIPQNDLGPRTDVLDGCRKREGIEIMLRGMAPQVIVVDELGANHDPDAIKMAWNAGVRIIATAHAYGLDDFKRRLNVGQLAAKDGFERIILLGMDNGKRWVKVIDANGNELSGLVKGDRMPDGIHGMHSFRDEAFVKSGREAACIIKTLGDPA